MELSLFSNIFKKLLESLKFGSKPVAEIDSPATREKGSFEVYSDGIPIRGRIYFPSAKPSILYPVIIICHGIPGSGQARPADDPGYEKLAEEFGSLGIASVVFNFRGCGDSGGNFDMMGWTRDLDVVLDTVANTPHIDPSRLMLLGFSGGGAASIFSAADNSRIFCLAVVGTPSDFSIFDHDPKELVGDFKERGIIRDADFPKDLDKWVQEFKEIEPRRWIAQFRGKHLLIIHGDADELIPLKQAEELFRNAPAGISELFIIPGGVHRLRLDGRCMDKLKSWFPEKLGWRKT